MNVLESAQDLIDEILHVFVSQRLAGVDDLMQIGVLEQRQKRTKAVSARSPRVRPAAASVRGIPDHQFVDDVHVVEFGERLGLHDVEDFDDLKTYTQHAHECRREMSHECSMKRNAMKLSHNRALVFH